MSSSGDIVFDAEKKEKASYQTLDLTKLRKMPSNNSSTNLSDEVVDHNILRKKTFDAGERRDRSSSDVFTTKKITRRSAEYQLHETTKESAEKTADLIEHLLQLVPTAMDVLSTKKICVSREKYDYLKKEYFRLKDEFEKEKKSPPPPLPAGPPPTDVEKKQRYQTVSLQSLSTGHVKQVQKRFLPSVPKKRTCQIGVKLRRWKLSSTITPNLALLNENDVLGKPPNRDGQMQSPEWMETLRRVVISQSAARRFLTRRQLLTFKKRSRVLDELLQTERSYLHQLHVLMDVYATPLIEEKVAGVDITHIKNGFTNLQSIVACNESFFVELQTCVNNDFVLDNAPYYIPVPKLGQLMSKYCLYMKCYVQYVIHFDFFITELTKMWEKRGAFSSFLDAQKEKNDTHMQFDALLAVSIQRIPRYTLLLNEIAKKSPLSMLGKKEFDLLQKAVHDFNQLGHVFNEAKRNAEFIDRTQHIVNAFSPRQRSELNLVQPYRKLVAEGFLYYQDPDLVEKNPVHVILFSDLFLIVNRNSGNSRTLRRKKSLENIFSDADKWKLAVADIESPALVGAEEISDADKRQLFVSQKKSGGIFGKFRHHESLNMIALVEISPKMSVRGLENDTENIFHNAFVFDALKVSYAFSAPSSAQRNNWLMHFENVLREIH